MSKYQIPKTYPEIGHGAIPEFTLNLKGNVFLYIAKANTHKSYIWVCSKSKSDVFLYIAKAHTHKISCQRWSIWKTSTLKVS